MPAQVRSGSGSSAPASGPRETHAAGIVDAPGAAARSGVGARPGSDAELADRHGAVACSDFDEFLEPRRRGVVLGAPARSGTAWRCAQPRQASTCCSRSPSRSTNRRRRLVTAVQSSGVAALVFFTHLFSPPVHDWFARSPTARWLGGEAFWLGSALTDDNPFNTPWRHEHGGLWDVGPHALVDLTRTLGPVVAVTADPGGTRRDPPRAPP